MNMKYLSSLSEMSAGEGLPIVLLSGLQAFGALALIIAVLVIMDKVFKKKHPNWEKEIEEEPAEQTKTDITSENGGGEE